MVLFYLSAVVSGWQKLNMLFGVCLFSLLKKTTTFIDMKGKKMEKIQYISIEVGYLDGSKALFKSE